MATQVCSECGSTDMVQSDTDISCDSCGMVMDLVDFSQEGGTWEDGGTQLVYKEERDRSNIVPRICSTLGISQNDTKVARGYFRETMKLKDKGFSGNVGKLRALACIYFATKAKPLSLSEIAEKCNVSKEDLGKAIKAYSNLLKSDQYKGNGDTLTTPKSPTLYTEKCLRLCCPDLPNPEILDMDRRCKLLVTISQQACLIEGRNPLGIVLSVTFFALETYSKQLTKRKSKEVCKAFSISQTTVNDRLKELKAHLVEKAVPVFPWKITEDSIAQTYPTLEPLLQEEFNTPEIEEPYEVQSETLPPCFIALREARKQRVEKVKQAKERIQSTFHKNMDKGEQKWDNEDLHIERMLLQGVEEEKIIQGYGTLPTPLPQHDMDGALSDKDLSQVEYESYVRGVGDKRKMASLPSLPLKKFKL